MRPLPAVLAGFAVGCVALQWQATLPSLPRCVGLALLLCALAVGTAARVHGALGRVTAMLLAALASAGAGHAYATWRAEVRLADVLPPQWEGVDIAIAGVVDDLPGLSPRGARFAFAVERVLTSGARVPERLSLAWFATAAGQLPAIRAGERWQLTVRLKRPHGNVNPGGFDLEAWLLENGFRATGYVHPQGGSQRIDAFAGRPGDYVQRARERVRDRALGALGDAPYAAVIVALAIGEQRAIPEAQWLVFNRTGITHLISISGLHVTVFAALAAALVLALARRATRLTIRLPAHRMAAAGGAAAALGYVLLAGAQVPALRTLVMLLVAAVGLWLAQPGTARTVWLWAVVMVLLLDPWAGLTPGFWLSFGAVALLLYAGTARLTSAGVSWRGTLARGFCTAARAQVVVTLGLVPLTLAIFQQVSLVAPLANALAIPVVTFGVVPLALAGIVLPFDFVWQLAHAVFAALMVPLTWLTMLPGNLWQQHAPPAVAVALALAGVVWLLGPPGLPLRSAGALWMLPLFVLRPPPPAHGAFVLTALDVGQGLAVVVRTHGHVLLYDTGPRYHDDVDAGGRIVAPYLRASGARPLATLVVTHQDSDHSGGTRSVLQTVPVREVLSSVGYADPLWSGVRGDVVRCRSGQQWQWDGVTFTILHPPPDAYAAARIKTNDLSCVLRIDSVHGSALLTGDIEARSEAVLLRDAWRLDADVLVVPHHGSRTSSTEAFVQATRPRIAIFTTGYRNRFGHPRADVVARYRSTGARLLRTDLTGAVTVTFGAPSTPDVVLERMRHRRYWYEVPVED